MARPSRPAQTRPAQKSVEVLRHEGATRKNIPTAECQLLAAELRLVFDEPR